ncbi:MAG: 4,5-DOPA dioxygenase extradiol [Rudaea sp.]
MNISSRMPALFVGHGSPMNAIEDNAFTRGWRAVATRIPRPRAILCVSAHWESRGVFVNTSAQPKTIHDFGGFPQALFDVQYPAPGDPELARRIARDLDDTPVHGTLEWGLDHGAWSVLNIMYPGADVPTLQLSIDTSRPGAFHYALGRKLSALRDDGVLILGSGNIVHNLRLLDFRNPTPPAWAVRIDAAAREHIERGEHAALIDWPTLGAQTSLAVPTPEHYVPLLYVLGAQREDDRVQLFNTELYGTLSMTSVIVGTQAIEGESRRTV